MSYNYEEEKKVVFTDEGQRMFLKIRDEANRLLDEAGAFRMGAVIRVVTGSSFEMMACVDRLVELGEISELTDSNVWGQDRVFVKTHKR